MSADAGSTVVPVPFDGEIYGRPWFRVRDANAVDLLEACRVAAGRSGAVVDAKVPSHRHEVVEVLLAFGFRRIITQLVFEVEPRALGATQATARISERVAYDDRTVAMHARNFIHSRYLRDPLLPAARSVELMRRWVRNSLEDASIGVVHDGTSFCTFRLRESDLRIDLVSVLEAGRGKGRALVQALLGHALELGADRVVVTTEAENLRALRLYTACGFRPCASEICLHYVAEPASRRGGRPSA